MTEILLFYVAGLPSVVRTDHGTENSVVAYIQPFLRRNGTDEFFDKSFRYGRSVFNQVCCMAMFK